MKIINISESNVNLEELFLNETQAKINFSKMQVSEIISVTDKILDYEESLKDKHINIHIDFKGLDTNTLCELYKHYLSRTTLVNTSLIANINILINGYNTLDDALFMSDIIYETDLEQLLDIKLELSDDIKEYQSQVSYWYLSCLKSMHKVEFTYLDTVVTLPNVYKKIISSSNLLTLSQILAKSKPINTKDLPLVSDAYPTIMSAATCSAIADKLVQSINL